MKQLVNEAYFLLVTGSDTITPTTARTTYYLVTYEKPLTKLKKELNHLPRTSDGHWHLTLTGVRSHWREYRLTSSYKYRQLFP